MGIIRRYGRVGRPQYIYIMTKIEREVIAAGGGKVYVLTE